VSRSNRRLSPEGRALIKCELEFTLAIIGEEVEHLKPLLMSTSSVTVNARYCFLARRWHEARELLNAMDDAELETQH
jgi:hypothetical protein